jgi:iron complex outermembrane receptor protein
VSRFYLHLSHRFYSDWSASVKLFHTLTVEPVFTYQYLNQAYFPPVSPNNLTVDRTVFEGDSRNRTDAAMIDVVGHANTFGLRHTVLVGGDYYYTPLGQPMLGYTCCFSTNFFNPAPVPRDAAINPPPGGFSFSGENNQASRDFGIYLQDQIGLPGRVHLLAGVRYQHYVETSDSSAAIGQPATSMVALADHVFTPRFGLLSRARECLSAYYSYTENFGKNSGFAFPNVPLAPENARQHEVGIKTEFYGGRLTSSLSWYQLTKFNIAAADPKHMSFNVDIGEVRNRGYEFDLQWGITANWDVITNFSFVLPYVVVGGNGYPVGNRLQGVPQYTFNLWTTYKFSQESLRGWKVGGGVNWRASSAYPGTALETDAYWDTSLLAAYEHPFGGYKATLQLNVSNLLDKTAIVNIYPVTSNNYADLNYATPREFRLSARVDF